MMHGVTKRAAKLFGTVALALSVSTCARNVTIEYTPSRLVLTPIRSTIDLRVEDGRWQAGQSISDRPQDIVVTRPVTEIVGEAVTAELAGQGIARGRGRRAVEIEVRTFNLGSRPVLLNNEFTGEVAFRAEVRESGRTLIDRVYHGSATERGWLTNAMIDRLMAAALTRAVQSLSSDAEFMRAAGRSFGEPDGVPLFGYAAAGVPGAE
jgi:hypothetical protein